MRLIEIIEALKAAALSQPAVRSIVPNDVYRLNATPNANYGVFSFVQGTHSRDENENFIRYAFTLFYVDRLTEDKQNEIEIQSTALDVLGNIIRSIEAAYCKGETQPINYTTFTESFSDECAGAFATVEFPVPVDTICVENY